MLVIQVGGKQYSVMPNKKIIVDGTVGTLGQTLTYKNLLGSESITAEIVAHARSPKVTSRKFRNKTRYHRVKGIDSPLPFWLLGLKKQRKKLPVPKKRPPK